jgi:HSP20 family protein
MAKDTERSWRGQIAPRYSDPFGALRSEMDRLFDSFMGRLPTFPSMFGPTGTRGFALMPSLDVKETDKEIAVEAELPGHDERMSHLRLRMAF